MYLRPNRVPGCIRVTCSRIAGSPELVGLVRKPPCLSHSENRLDARNLPRFIKSVKGKMRTLIGLAVAVSCSWAQGTLYESDKISNTINKFTLSGVQSTFVSSGLSAPEGLAFDAMGNLYEADFNTGKVQKFDPNGNLLDGSFITGLSLPIGLAFDAMGNLYVSDYGNGNIKKFGPSGGAAVLSFGTGLSPYALAFDSAGTLYEADWSSGTIKTFDTSGNLLNGSFITGLSFPQGLAFDAAGNLYVSDQTQFVEKYSSAGTLINAHFASGFINPFGLAFDTFGNLYVADFYDPGTIKKFDSNGNSLGDFATGLVYPTFLAFSPGPDLNAMKFSYVTNLNAGDSFINITNTGSSDGNLCVSVYAFDPSEEMVACCSCLVSPNALVSLSVQGDLLSNTLSPSTPTSLVIGLIATQGSGALATCAPGLGGSDAAAALAPGLRAWSNTIHALPGTPVHYGMTENDFQESRFTISEFNHLTSFCGFINSNGSGFGICKTCRNGGLGGVKK